MCSRLKKAMRNLTAGYRSGILERTSYGQLLLENSGVLMTMLFLFVQLLYKESNEIKRTERLRPWFVKAGLPFPLELLRFSGIFPELLKLPKLSGSSALFGTFSELLK